MSEKNNDEWAIGYGPKDRELSQLFVELGQPFPDNAYKKVKYGSREFITLDAYSIVERLTRIAGPCSVGWGWKDLEFQFHADSVSCIGIFWIKDPYTDVTIEVPAVGDGAIIKGSSAAEAAKKAQTNMMSKAVSFIGVGTIDLYQGKMLDCPLTDRASQNSNATPPPPALPPPPTPYPAPAAETGAPPPPERIAEAPASGCPKCHSPHAVAESKAEYGGGWYCDKKKGGCGATWGGQKKWYEIVNGAVAAADCEKASMTTFLIQRGMLVSTDDDHRPEWKSMDGAHKDMIKNNPEAFINRFTTWYKTPPTEVVVAAAESEMLDDIPF